MLILISFYNQNDRFCQKQLIIGENRNFLLPVVEDKSGNVEETEEKTEEWQSPSLGHVRTNVARQTAEREC